MQDVSAIIFEDAMPGDVLVSLYDFEDTLQIIAQHLVTCKHRDGNYTIVGQCVCFEGWRPFDPPNTEQEVRQDHHSIDDLTSVSAEDAFRARVRLTMTMEDRLVLVAQGRADTWWKSNPHDPMPWNRRLSANPIQIP